MDLVENRGIIARSRAAGGACIAPLALTLGMAQAQAATP